MQKLKKTKKKIQTKKQNKTTGKKIVFCKIIEKKIGKSV